MTFLVYTTVLFTIISALGLGIFAGYAIIIGLLRLFGYSTRVKAQAPAAVPAMHAAIAQASGD